LLNPAGLPCGLLGFSLPTDIRTFLFSAGFASGKSGGKAMIAEPRLCSKKPKLPQGKPEGFSMRSNVGDGDQPELPKNATPVNGHRLLNRSGIACRARKVL
jgi:hypothetical protein